ALAVAGGAGEGPLGHAGSRTLVDEVLLVTVVDVGQALEAPGEAGPRRGLAHVARAPGVGPARHFEDAVLGEVRHDSVEIVRVEGVAELDQLCADVHRCLPGAHAPYFPASRGVTMTRPATPPF